jgi:hypothetical protein
MKNYYRGSSLENGWKYQSDLSVHPITFPGCLTLRVLLTIFEHVLGYIVNKGNVCFLPNPSHRYLVIQAK